MITEPPITRVAQIKQAFGLLTSGGCLTAPFRAFYHYGTLACQFTNQQPIGYSWFIHIVIFRWLLNLAAKILIIIELYKTFDAFSVVCGNFVRSFVKNSFGCL